MGAFTEQSKSGKVQEVNSAPEQISLSLNCCEYYLHFLYFIQVDCTVFGMLSQIVYVDFSYAHKDLLITECTNIMPYMERIRRKYWPDWDNIVATGHFE